MKQPIRLTVISIGILLVGLLIWLVGPVRIYCLRTYPPPTWDNPPIHPEAKDISVTLVDRLQQSTLLRGEDEGPTLFHKVVTYTIAPDTKAMDEYLFDVLVRDCWDYNYSLSPGTGGSEAEHVFEWTKIGQSRPVYYYDIVTRQIPSGDYQILIRTRRTPDK